MVHFDDVHLSDNHVCNTCNEHFHTELNLEDHIKKIHGASAFICAWCGWKTLYYLAYEEHIGMHYRENKYKCFDCDMGSSDVSRYNIKTHVLRHLSKSSTDSLQCEICEKYFTRRQILSHMKRHGDIEDTFKCEKCLCFCKTATALVVHLQSVHWIYRCDDCEFVTPSNSILYHHKKSKHKIVDYVECKDCRYFFPTRWAFRQHAAQMHPTSSWEDLAAYKNSLDCSICGKVNQNVQALIRHMSVHPEYRSKLCNNPLFFKCNLCKLLYTSKRLVRIHITKAHFEASNDSYDITKELKCTVCGKAGSNLRNLNRHISSHKNIEEKHFIKCRACHLFYISYRAFSAHVRIAHSSGKQDYQSQSKLKCGFCGIVYKNVRCINQHTKLAHRHLYQTERNNYIRCRCCRYYNTTEAGFKQHVAKEHPGSSPDELIENVDELKCWICSKVKFSTRYINRHIRSHSLLKKWNNTDNKLLFNK